MHGSRMQEGQRIGRVQRPMPGKTEALFYSIVALGTEEVDYAEHRRRFLGTSHLSLSLLVFYDFILFLLIFSSD